jgi:uncharacterized protein
MKKQLRLAVVLALGASGGWAVDWKERYPKPEGYVSDFALAIDSAGRSRLEAYAKNVQQVTGAQMALVTIPSLDGEPLEDVANAIFRAWEVGEHGKDDGIMLLFSIGDHRTRLEVGRGLEAILPAGLSGDILSEMRPALRKDDVGDAMIAAAQTIGAAIAKARNVRLTASLPPRRNRPETSDYVNWISIAGLVALVWLFSRTPGPSGNSGGGWGALPWLVLGNLRGGRSGFGSRGSGGFGGFDSGDGFGGFGGGDCGSGRASSDW